MTVRQAQYQARRAYDAEFNRKMHDPDGPGRNRERQDSAFASASMAYAAKMIEWGWPDNSTPRGNQNP